MKFGIWRHINKKLNDAKLANLIDNDLDTSIVEISFGMKSFDLLNRLVELDKISSNIELQTIVYKKNKGYF